MIGASLAEKVRNDFFKVKLKKAIVKVPNIKAKKPRQVKFHEEITKDNKIPTSLLVRILIRNALENAKKVKKEAKQSVQSIKYKHITKEKDFLARRYGTVSRFYEISPKTPYVNYQKLFNYLGQFKAKGSFYSDVPTEALNSSIESKSFELVSRETLDKGARYAKYFFPKVADFHSNLTSLVPVAGMSSADWEQFKLMMLLDPVMYALKSRIA